GAAWAAAALVRRADAAWRESSLDWLEEAGAGDAAIQAARALAPEGPARPSRAIVATVWAAGAAGAAAMTATGAAEAWAAAVLAAALMTAVLADLQARLLPDEAVAAAAALGFWRALQGGGPGLEAAVIGGIAGWGGLWALATAYRGVRGRDGLGLGDAKLAGAAGLWCGWAGLPLVLLAASLAGVIALLAQRAFGKADGATRLPFGPFIAAGMVAALAAGLG
ncbi:MAG: A24 family peptidase, partial [Pseudomonadota bacterium]